MLRLSVSCFLDFRASFSQSWNHVKPSMSSSLSAGRTEGGGCASRTLQQTSLFLLVLPFPLVPFSTVSFYTLSGSGPLPAILPSPDDFPSVDITLWPTASFRLSSSPWISAFLLNRTKRTQCVISLPQWTSRSHLMLRISSFVRYWNDNLSPVIDVASCLPNAYLSTTFYFL